MEEKNNTKLRLIATISRMGLLFHTIFYFWKPLLVFLTPIILSPIAAFNEGPRGSCGYVIIIMIIFWMTEALPLAVTGLIPVFAFPLLGVLSTGEVCEVYMNDSNMLFLGGMIMAAAVMHCKLDKRIALIVLCRCGRSFSAMLGGVMSVTMFLSMWINNAAAAAVMVPIAHAILKELDKKETYVKDNNRCVLPKITVTDVEDEKDIGVINGGYHESEELRNVHHEIQVFEGGYTIMDSESSPDAKSRSENYKKCLFLGIAYAANIGGTGVLTGTPPNLLLIGILRHSFRERINLNYMTWMAVNIPGMLICTLLSWMWLQHMYTGLNFRWKKKSKTSSIVTKDKKESIKSLLESEYENLGSVSYHEWVVIFLMLALILLWIFRAPGVMTGWVDYLIDEYKNPNLRILNATPIMLIVVILFALPCKLPSNIEAIKEAKGKQCCSCLTWEDVSSKISWGTIMILGGGFAMAAASQQSNLPMLIENHLSFLGILPVPILVLIFTLLAIVATNIASNNATAAIFLPVLRELSLGLCVNPLYFMLPVAICCSYAFMLPVATPPNAIVYESAKLRSADLMKAGLGINVLCVIVVNIMINTLGVAILDLNRFPAWANSTYGDFQSSC